MITRCLPAGEEAWSLGGKIIRAGGLVAFATETVYGLGADAFNPRAVEGIFRAKGRPADNPLIVHVASAEEGRRVADFSPRALELARVFWPGPLTLLLPRLPRVPALVSAGLATVAVRMPGHEAALGLIRAAETPLAAPSANLSGRPSPTEARHVLEDLGGRIPLVIDAGPCRVGLESTVLDLTAEHPAVLRPGAVTPEQIAAVCGSCTVAEGAMRLLGESEAAPSPGMRHRHYAPRGKLTLFAGPEDRVAEAIRRSYDEAPGACILCLKDRCRLYGDRRLINLGDDAAQAAHSLFAALRRLDGEGVQRILCESLPGEGLGLAVMNRLLRAADFDVVSLDRPEPS